MCHVATEPSLPPEVIDAGVVDYRTMWSRQLDLFGSMLEQRRQGLKPTGETIFLVEHTPVYTLGRHGKRQNMLWNADALRQAGIEMIEIERGGDITYHGPGQLVVYPVIDMLSRGLGVKSYIDTLEQAVIDTIAHYGIKGERDEGATGVWIEPDTPRARKICAIGVKCSRFITMHGLALNVSTDLDYFRAINPCGFVDRGVTSIECEVQRPVDMAEVKQLLSMHLLSLLVRTSH